MEKESARIGSCLFSSVIYHGLSSENSYLKISIKNCFILIFINSTLKTHPCFRCSLIPELLC